jgi:hypothetical protein
MQVLVLARRHVEARSERGRREYLCRQPTVFGELSSVKLTTDKAADRPRGFAFVEMPSQSEAEAAIKGLDGTFSDRRPFGSTSPVMPAIGDKDERPPRRPQHA